MEPLTVRDFEALAREKMEPTAWDYFAGGVEDELSLAENEAAFRRVKLRPRMLVNVTQRDLTTTVLGTPLAFPVILAPTTYQRLAHPDAEMAVARAAAAMGVVACLGTGNHYSVEEVAAEVKAPLWFQPYWYVNRTIIERLVRRAEDAGCRALVVTVDASYPARRERQLRRQLVVPPDVEQRNLVGIGLEERPAETSGGAKPLIAAAGGFIALVWDDLAWLRRITRLPLLVKGILTAEDAVMAVEHGVEGILVSNHGARQVDTVIPAIEALPEVVDAVAGRAEILLDSGVRRGTDVLKALALGARAVMIGRPFLWGLAVAGEAGVRQILEIFRAEIDTNMTQLGRPTIASIDRTLVKVPADWGAPPRP